MKKTAVVVDNLIKVIEAYERDHAEIYINNEHFIDTLKELNSTMRPRSVSDCFYEMLYPDTVCILPQKLNLRRREEKTKLYNIVSRNNCLYLQCSQSNIQMTRPSVFPEKMI